MQAIRKYLGLLWMAIGVAAIALLLFAAVKNIGHAKGDIGKPVPWLIIIGIFAPTAVGLIIFGRYALSGAYEPRERTGAHGSARER